MHIEKSDQWFQRRWGWWTSECDNIRGTTFGVSEPVNIGFNVQTDT